MSTMLRLVGGALVLAMPAGGVATVAAVWDATATSATAATVARHAPAARHHRAVPGPKPNLRLRGITVLAAASLTDVFQAMAPRVTYSFAGSDQLAFQIQQGAPADVFASANTRYPDRLHAQGLVGTPVVFTRNRLVVIIPKSNPAHITSIQDLTRPGIKLVVGDQNVPIGAYTRAVLGRMGLSGALRNVVSNETDVRAVVAKVALGEADAGVAYVTDLYQQRAKLRAFAFPASAQPTATYAIAVVRASRHRREAAAFVRYLRSRDGKRFLTRFGFSPDTSTGRG